MTIKNPGYTERTSMNKEEYLRYGRIAFALSKNILTGQMDTSFLSSDVDYQLLFEVAVKHKIGSIVGCAFKALDIKSGIFEDQIDKAQFSYVWYQIEKDSILNEIGNNKIWYMPLKGAILQEYYPEPFMREVCDCDVLFDWKYREKIREIMEDKGYITISYAGNHDVYQKFPCLCFEMHNSLYGKSHDKKFYTYYHDVYKRLVSTNGNDYEKVFTNEDFYVYMISHEYKHYYNGGFGLRSILDTYVFLSRFENDLDKDYISQELSKLGLVDFELINRKLVKKLFSDISLDQQENDMLDYIITSGAYGNLENNTKNAIEKSGSLIKFLWRRLYPDLDTISVDYPLAYKYKVLIPVLPIVRFYKAQHRGKRIKKEIMSIIHYIKNNKT